MPADLSREERRQLDALLDEALELDGDELKAFLAGVESEKLRRKLEALIENAEDSLDLGPAIPSMTISSS